MHLVGCPTSVNFSSTTTVQMAVRTQNTGVSLMAETSYRTIGSVTVPVRLNFVMVTLAVRFPPLVNYSTRPPIGARQLMLSLTFTTMLQKTNMLGSYFVVTSILALVNL